MLIRRGDFDAAESAIAHALDMTVEARRRPAGRRRAGAGRRARAGARPARAKPPPPSSRHSRSRLAATTRSCCPSCACGRRALSPTSTDRSRSRADASANAAARRRRRFVAAVRRVVDTPRAARGAQPPRASAPDWPRPSPSASRLDRVRSANCGTGPRSSGQTHTRPTRRHTAGGARPKRCSKARGARARAAAALRGGVRGSRSGSRRGPLLARIAQLAQRGGSSSAPMTRQRATRPQRSR